MLTTPKRARQGSKVSVATMMISVSIYDISTIYLRYLRRRLTARPNVYTSRGSHHVLVAPQMVSSSPSHPGPTKHHTEPQISRDPQRATSHSLYSIHSPPNQRLKKSKLASG